MYIDIIGSHKPIYESNYLKIDCNHIAAEKNWNDETFGHDQFP